METKETTMENEKVMNNLMDFIKSMSNMVKDSSTSALDLKKYIKPIGMGDIIRNNPLKGKLQQDDFILIHHRNEEGEFKPSYITLKEFRDFLMENTH